MGRKVSVDITETTVYQVTYDLDDLDVASDADEDAIREAIEEAWTSEDEINPYFVAVEERDITWEVE